MATFRAKHAPTRIESTFATVRLRSAKVKGRGGHTLPHDGLQGGGVGTEALARSLGATLLA